MKTKREHNEAATEAYRQSLRTDVACDACGAELLYTDNRLRLSDPPQREVRCSGCGIFTFIVA